MKRSTADLVRAWLVKAEKDVIVATEMLTRGGPFTDVVCFHAQQCAEKALKACLVWHGIDFPKTHVLEDLLDLLSQRDARLEHLGEALRSLTPFAVETRYPEMTQPSLEEAEAALGVARRVYEAALGQLPAAIRPPSLES